LYDLEPYKVKDIIFSWGISKQELNNLLRRNSILPYDWNGRKVILSSNYDNSDSVVNKLSAEVVHDSPASVFLPKGDSFIETLDLKTITLNELRSYSLNVQLEIVGELVSKFKHPDLMERLHFGSADTTFLKMLYNNAKIMRDKNLSDEAKEINNKDLTWDERQAAVKKLIESKIDGKTNMERIVKNLFSIASKDYGLWLFGLRSYANKEKKFDYEIKVYTREEALDYTLTLAEKRQAKAREKEKAVEVTSDEETNTERDVVTEDEDKQSINDVTPSQEAESVVWGLSRANVHDLGYEKFEGMWYWKVPYSKVEFCFNGGFGYKGSLEGILHIKETVQYAIENKTYEKANIQIRIKESNNTIGCILLRKERGNPEDFHNTLSNDIVLSNILNEESSSSSSVNEEVSLPEDDAIESKFNRILSKKIKKEFSIGCDDIQIFIGEIYRDLKDLLQSDEDILDIKISMKKK
jgi:hypothetical protein